MKKDKKLTKNVKKLTKKVAATFFSIPFGQIYGKITQKELTFVRETCTMCTETHIVPAFR
jgi:hypothetical protein